MASGRPTLYKQEYCDQIIEFMATGKSLTAFAASINTYKQNLYNWAKINKEFFDAMKNAQAKCQAWWEEEGAKGLWQEDKQAKLSPAIWIFTMKARFGMSDQPKQDILEEDTEPLEQELQDIYAKERSEK